MASIGQTDTSAAPRRPALAFKKEELGVSQDERELDLDRAADDAQALSEEFASRQARDAELSEREFLADEAEDDGALEELREDLRRERMADGSDATKNQRRTELLKLVAAARDPQEVAHDTAALDDAVRLGQTRGHEAAHGMVDLRSRESRRRQAPGARTVHASRDAHHTPFEDAGQDRSARTAQNGRADPSARHAQPAAPKRTRGRRLPSSLVPGAPPRLSPEENRGGVTVD